MALCKKKPILLIVLFLCFAYISASKVSSRGGYSITIAIDETNSDPNEGYVNKYVENIRVILNQFSLRLWKASRGTFFLQEANVLLPKSWNGNENLEIAVATTESYATSDIRITSSSSRPYVENPNPCGNSGQFIELPISYFENTVTGIYGNPAAGLVNQWARYRYGVWEEHGYPNSKEFPYFFKMPNGTSWHMTGCSDYPISGKYRDSNDETCDHLDILIRPKSDCRLEPDYLNTATTSIMHLHWLNTVEGFCDEGNHNADAPNRQNLLCGHRSVWEVITKSLDYKSVSNPLEISENEDSDVLPVVQVNFVKESQLPRFYLLIDQGRSQAAPYVTQALFGNLTKYFIDTFEHDTLGSLGLYPNEGANCDSSGLPYVAEQISWSTVAETRDLFALSVTNAADVSKGPLVRDFGRAIYEVVEKISSQNVEAGAVILVIKTGVGLNTFGQLAYEQEVTAALKQAGNIRLYAVELQNNDVDQAKWNVNLETLAKASGGKHAVVSKSLFVATRFIPMMDEVVKVLSEPILKPETNFVQIYNGFVPANSPVQIPILANNLESLEFHLTTGKFIQSGMTIVPDSNPEGHNVLPVLDTRNEWDEGNDSKRRTSYSLLAKDDISANTTWTLQYPCEGEESECRGRLTVYGYQQKTTRVKRSTVENIEILVSTSAGNNIVDMSEFIEIGHIQSPFSIFTKVSTARQPVRNLIVTATIELEDKSESWTIDLNDDGNFIPDVAKYDGIYSGNFIPPKDGLYRISVSVQTSKDIIGNGESGPVISLIIPKPSLLPKDQQNMECTTEFAECRSIALSQNFQRVVQFTNVISVINSITYTPGRPYRITDFEVITAPNHIVYLVFTAPKLIGRNGSADQFKFYYSPRAKNLIGTTDGNFNAGANIGVPPGEKVVFRYATMQEVTVYYAVEAEYGGLQSGPSNIVGVKTHYEDLNPTTTTTSTSKPATEVNTGPVPTIIGPLSTPVTSQSPSSPIRTSTTSLPITSQSPSTSIATQLPISTTTTQTSATSTTPTTVITSTTTSTPIQKEKPWIQKSEGIIIICTSILVLILLSIGVFAGIRKRCLRSRDFKINDEVSSL